MAIRAPDGTNTKDGLDSLGDPALAPKWFHVEIYEIEYIFCGIF